MKTYGSIKYIYDTKQWVVYDAQPHICIRMKSIFPKIDKTQVMPFFFSDTPENAHDLLWFMERYPLHITEDNLLRLKRKSREYTDRINDMERIMLPEYKARVCKLKDGLKARDYQLKGKDLWMMKKRLLIGDDTGLGKTLIAILGALESGTLPMVIVVQAHLPTQWKAQIEKFTDLKVHIIKGNQPYSLDKHNADVYITTYSRLSGWVDLYGEKFYRTAVFDEAQELRRFDSQKYRAAKILSDSVEYCLLLTATPIYNYGDEIWNVVNCMQDNALGSWKDFQREWTRFGKEVVNPQALGTYLRESYVMLRRTRQDVGRELPPVNKIIHTVEYNSDEAEKNANITRMLAIRVISGSFVERGQAARELDIMVRKDTGVGKAWGVANYVRIILENNEPVILAGWHRDVYDIWLEALADFKPVMYTGTESPAAKEKAKKDFIDGKTNLFIISLRSGVGLDGLQARCNTVVIGELDWSPKVHEQLISRADRDGQKEQVTAIYLVCDEGSDPLIINMLGLKASQSTAIVDPLRAVEAQYSDDSRMKLLAEQYLTRHKK